MHVSRIVVAGALLGLAGCGSGSRLMNSGNFSGTVATQSDRATGTLTSRAGVDVTGKICTKWNERESTWRKSGSCQSRGTNQSKS
jgi:hypothetical protein